VLSIDIAKGVVTAKVQGSRPKPYDVTIKVKVLAPAEWQQLLQALSGQALYAAKLLAGEMPHDIEHVFEEARLSLFPQKLQDLTTECSCPDWSNPCKHIAAVYYLLGEEFDRDPFLLFQLRGLGRDELLLRLGETGPTPKARLGGFRPNSACLGRSNRHVPDQPPAAVRQRWAARPRRRRHRGSCCPPVVRVRHAPVGAERHPASPDTPWGLPG
jgi:uncharacterized Zn finger protein